MSDVSTATKDLEAAESATTPKVAHARKLAKEAKALKAASKPAKCWLDITPALNSKRGDKVRMVTQTVGGNAYSTYLGRSKDPNLKAYIKKMKAEGKIGRAPDSGDDL